MKVAFVITELNSLESHERASLGSLCEMTSGFHRI
jgi:hypothetical protein